MTSSKPTNIPLAEQMRPRKIEEFVGQEHLLGEGKLLRRLISEKYVPSLLLWGPPGTGKTTLAHILARSSSADFIFFSAVLSGVKEIRNIVSQAQKIRDESGNSTILFVDEIHRFNKSQQDAFLPHVENGLLTLIGATTENPSFQVIAPLLSRCRTLVLNRLSPDNLREIIKNTLSNPERGLGNLNIEIDDQALDHISNMADGDARTALNSLEIAASFANSGLDGKSLITLAIVEEAIQRKSLVYDANGEEHYNLISALHKSLRDSDPDGALYWLARMLKAGEEPLYITRRLIRFASEDIGNADPQALTTALNARDSYHFLGSPEGELSLAQAVLYLATAPKSNAAYMAYKEVMRDIERTGSLPVPMHLRNAPSKLMKELDYGKNYQYAHDNRYALVDQQHMPRELEGKTYYQPANRGHEALIRDRLTKWRKILAKEKRKK